MEPKQNYGSGFLIAILVLIVLALAGLLYLEKAKDTITAPEIGASVIQFYDTTYVQADKIEDDMKLILDDAGEESYVVYNGNTWVKVEGGPMELVIVNDATCGQPCDTTQVINTLKQAVTPALIITTVDIESDRGQALKESFGLTNVPAYFLPEGVKEKPFYASAQQGLTEKDGLLLIDGNAFRFPKGQMIEAPEFDTADDPRKGTNGTIDVIEFYAFECGYCKKFHDDSGAMIDQLVEEGKINFIPMDFPLWGDTNHIKAACFGEQGKFWEAHDDMYANSAAWSRAEDGGVAYFDGLIDQLGIDKAAWEECLTDPAIKAEIAADQAQGQKYGVTGTPALFIGEQFVPGAVDPERLRALVEAEIAKQ